MVTESEFWIRTLDEHPRLDPGPKTPGRAIIPAEVSGFRIRTLDEDPGLESRPKTPGRAIIPANLNPQRNPKFHRDYIFEAGLRRHDLDS